MNYDSKIQFVREIIEAHNSVVDESLQIDFNKVLTGLQQLGATSIETLKSVRWEDLEDKCDLPRAMARTVAQNFRKDGNGSTGKSAYASERKVKTMSYKELLERYNPKDSKSNVAKRLRDLSDNKAFIVFDKGNKVIVDKSVGLLEDIMEGLEEVTTTHVDGIPTPVFKVGERPDFYLEENPLYPGEALRSGETCIHTGRSWTGISMAIRQLLWLAVDDGELEIITPADAIDVMDKVIKSDMKALRGRYQVASLTFDELSKLGKLPTLKVRIGEKTCSEKSGNPFGDHITS